MNYIGKKPNKLATKALEDSEVDQYTPYQMPTNMRGMSLGQDDSAHYGLLDFGLMDFGLGSHDESEPEDGRVLGVSPQVFNPWKKPRKRKAADAEAVSDPDPFADLSPSGAPMLDYFMR